jgi:hypothetical protein
MSTRRRLRKLRKKEARLVKKVEQARSVNARLKLQRRSA